MAIRYRFINLGAWFDSPNKADAELFRGGTSGAKPKIVVTGWLLTPPPKQIHSYQELIRVL